MSSDDDINFVNEMFNIVFNNMLNYFNFFHLSKGGAKHLRNIY